MRVRIDPGADAARVEFSDQPPAAGRSREVADGVVLDVDADGRPVAIEVLWLGARSALPYAVDVEVAEGPEELPPEHPPRTALSGASTPEGAG